MHRFFSDDGGLDRVMRSIGGPVESAARPLTVEGRCPRRTQISQRRDLGFDVRARGSTGARGAGFPAGRRAFTSEP